MRFLLWVFRCAPLFLGIPLLSCVTKPYNRAFASVSCSVFKYTSGHRCPPYAQHGSWWPDITPAPAHASLSPAFSFQPVQTLSQRKPSWRCVKRHLHLEPGFCPIGLFHRFLLHTYWGWVGDIQMLGKLKQQDRCESGGD